MMREEEGKMSGDGNRARGLDGFPVEEESEGGRSVSEGKSDTGSLVFKKPSGGAMDAGRRRRSEMKEGQ